jgi:N-acetylmuramoyl-L-alanine amidase
VRRCARIALAILLACAFYGRAETAELPRLAKPADPREVELLALSMYHEAKGEGRAGMLAVGWVVLNRVADPGYPDSVEGVVRQGCQFGWTCDDRPDEPTHRAAWRQALGLAERLLAAAPPADPTRGALSFHHATNESPGWESGGRVAPSVRIGDHLFYARVDRLPRPARKPWRALQVAQR